MPFPKGRSNRVAKKTAAQRNTDLAACIVALAENLCGFLVAAEINIPELQDSLRRIQELAYSTVPKEETPAFGLTYAATQGIVLPTDNGQSVEQSEPVAVQT